MLFRSVNIPVVYDYIERCTRGMFASKISTFDPTTKRYVTKLYDMVDTFPDQKHLNVYPLASNKSIYRYSTYMSYMSKYTGNFTGYGDVTNANTLQNRLSLLAQIDANKLEITVPGRLDYTVGLKVRLKFYKIQPANKDDSDVIDNILSGDYIIAAINHYISRNLHECTIEVVKESILLDLDRNK